MLGVKRKVGVDMDWRVDTWDSKRCACEWPKISRQWNFIQCLSLSFGDTIATSCVLFFFFLAGCIMCTNGWRKKNFLKIGVFFFNIFYTLLHHLIKVKTIFFTQLFKRLPLSAASNSWFNCPRCHVVKFSLEFCLMMILSPM